MKCMTDSHVALWEERQVGRAPSVLVAFGGLLSIRQQL